MTIFQKQINHYLNYCANVRKMSATTLTSKRSTLNRFAEITRCHSLKNLTNEVFNHWIEYETGHHVSPRSINTYNAIILAMVKYYREMGATIPLKTPLIKKLKEGSTRRNFYTHAQIQQVLKFADPKTALMIRICFETGLRISELTNLRLLNFTNCRINFIGKGNKPREVYISAATFQAMQQYIAQNQITDYLWAAKPGKLPPTSHGIRKRLRRPFLKAGFPDFYPHALRHSFATDLQARGASIEEIREMVGHESIATTERYLHALDGHLSELFLKYR